MAGGRARRWAVNAMELGLVGAVLAVWTTPVRAAGALQCVPYARAHSEVKIIGDARTWWARAGERYARGASPAKGAVLALRGTAAMPGGHVAVVRAVLDGRHVLLDHANWSRPGAVEKGALAEDVSPDGDWSAVRVWYGPGGRLGTRRNPAFGFIYARAEDRPDVPWLRADSVIRTERSAGARVEAENVALFEG